MSGPSDPFTPDDEYATVQCSACGFAWDRLLALDPGEDEWRCPICGEPVTLGDEIDVYGESAGDDSDGE